MKSMPLDAPEPALQTVGNYDLIEKVAEGGMGSVYKARHRNSGQIVAIKIVASHITGNQVLLKRFEQEYKAAQQLDHPNIVKALEFGTSGSTPFLVMEFVQGESLGRKIEREGRMAEKDAIRLIAQVAQALYRSHKEKLIHRDVKPDNILITPDGQAKLTDLGLVKEVEADLNLTRTGRGLGTPHFMAPEQFKNAKNVDPRCDIYSLGATLYMMVTGELPFRSSGPLDAYMKKMENNLTPPRQLVPTLSERIDWAIRRSMSADLDQRPANCREFVEDLTGRSTRKVTGPDNAPVNTDFWYLVYKDEEGEVHTVKGTTVNICRSLREGLLGDASNVRASRVKDSGFEPLRSYPEFRHLVVGPAPFAAAAPTKPAAPRPRRAVKPVAERKPAAAPKESPPEDRLVSPPLGAKRSSRGSRDWTPWIFGLVVAAVVAVSAMVGFLFFRP
jgi:serine/threonine protein kinase